MKPRKEAPAASSSPVKVPLDRFAAFFKERSAAHGIVGASLRVIGFDGALLHVSYGLKDRVSGAPTDEATIYHWASITKTLTGIAIMQLRDRGKLKLDDPIIKYVPEIKMVHDPYGDTSEITIAQLLSHTAGFRAATFPWGGEKDWYPPEPT